MNENTCYHLPESDEALLRAYLRLSPADRAKVITFAEQLRAKRHTLQLFDALQK